MDQRFFNQRSVGLLGLLILLVIMMPVTQGSQAFFNLDNRLFLPLFMADEGSSMPTQTPTPPEGPLPTPPDGPTATPPDGPTPTPTPTVTPITTPAISLDKSADPQTYTYVGDVITYTFKAVNTGDVTLTDVTITDPLPGLSALDCGDPGQPATLQPGERLECTATYTITAADVVAREVNNEAAVTGTPPTGPAVTDTDSSVVNALAPVNMVFVPPGTFQMGCDPAHNGGIECLTIELPQHTVYLDPFYIDIPPVKNSQYAQCVAEGVCSPPANLSSSKRTSYYGNSTYNNYPVIWVNWDQADVYCEWAGKNLPTEAQWEKAARGLTLRAFPWGDAMPTCGHANFKDCSPEEDTTKVGSYLLGASPYNVLDMAGNVLDWVRDWYSGTEYQDRVDGGCGTGVDPACVNPTGPASDPSNRKAIRGGNWFWSWEDLRVARRRPVNINTDGSTLIGFRCVLEIED